MILFYKLTFTTTDGNQHRIKASSPDAYPLTKQNVLPFLHGMGYDVDNVTLFRQLKTDDR